jgi:hypothetical protein
MGFFDDVSRIGADTPYPRGGQWDHPEAEFPSVAASALLLARTEGSRGCTHGNLGIQGGLRILD